MMRPMFRYFRQGYAPHLRPLHVEGCHRERSEGYNPHRQYPLPGARRASLGKADMLLNTATPQIEVNPETFDVYVDGKARLRAAATKELSLGQLYWFS